jgi:UDP-N-acetylglucosamine 1-carboxyvinyltransferase
VPRAYEALACLIIKHRAELGFTQQQLAERAGTSPSAVSRMESGQHPTKPEIRRRLSAALGMHLVIGFESGPKERPTRKLITL